MKDNWYILHHPEQIDSPALLVWPDRVQHNINEMLRMAGSADRLMPHVKTIKMPDIVKLQMKAGIHRFKCATIAEAEMLADTGAQKVLIAYQLHGPKADRLLQLIRKYPRTHFASLIDNSDSAKMLNDLFADHHLRANVYIDVDNGMHRTGFPVSQDLVAFYKKVAVFSNLTLEGLHVYDGHLRQPDFETRKKECETAFIPVKEAVKAIEAAGFPTPEVIAGGSPAFPVHAANPEVICSPGTTLLWDAGYKNAFPEMPFLPAAVLLTRIISKQTFGNKYYITTDLGHKSVAAENSIDKRIFFLNLNNYKISSQSEEHLVVEMDKRNWEKLERGEVLYGIPHHICPTVALYDEVQVVENGAVSRQWKVVARKKKISI